MGQKCFDHTFWFRLAKSSIILILLLTIPLPHLNRAASPEPTEPSSEADPSSPSNPSAAVETSPTPTSPAVKIAIKGGVDALLQKIQQHGVARVIAKLDVPFAPLGELNEVQTEEALQAIHQAQLALQQSLSSYHINNLILFQYIPFAALDVDVAALEALMNLPFVSHIEENSLHKAILDLSVPRIGAPLVWGHGYDGSGMTIAVLDSGVHKTHPFLSGKVISEACYSTTNTAAGSISLCPSGVSQSTAADSAMPYLSGICPAGICDHGTHVAGILSGSVGQSLSGVAPNAKLIAIQVFSYFPNDDDIYTWTSDYILGLERVYALRSTYSIAAVNMSLGGTTYSDQTICDLQNQAVKAAIDNLRSVNIPVVIAAGNDRSPVSISRPACISSAISVGATDDADQVAVYSNSANFLTLLAPGSAINSSIPPDQYASWNGTSMATPHAAAAFALFRQAKPAATVEEMLDALTSSGVYILDQRNGLTKPRIQINAALDLLLNTTPSGTTQRVSLASDGSEANAASYSPSISGDGRLVAFYSDATNLVPNDTNNKSDVFVYDRLTNQIARVSVTSDGSQSDGDSTSPYISSDGKFVAFQSDATNLVSNDTNGMTDIFVHNLSTGQTSRVSIASNGTQANGNSYYPALSSSGRYVVFTSDATNLVSGDTNNMADVFLHDRQTGITSRISVSSSADQANNSSTRASISADGQIIAFSSFASNLVSNDTNNAADVFIHDTANGQTQRVSIASGGNQAHGHSLEPSISKDGKLVAFISSAPDLVPNDTNDKWDIFVHDLQSGLTSRVSVADHGIQSNGNSPYQPALSANGRFIAFWSDATNLVAGDANGVADVFVHDRFLQQTQRISLAYDGSEGNGAVNVRVSLSDDGTYAAFESTASNLVSNDTNGSADVFVRRVVYTLPAPTLIAPVQDTTTSDWLPTFSWYPVAGAAQYQWRLRSLTTQDGVIEQTFTPDQANCASSSPCSFQSPQILSHGPYAWKVRAINLSGAGAWSDEALFTTPSIPSAVTLIAPLSVIRENQPVFRWYHLPTAQKYRLWVSGKAGVVIRQEIDPARYQCTSSANECRFTAPQKLPKGQYQWWVQAHNPSGDANWSAAGSFSIE